MTPPLRNDPCKGCDCETSDECVGNKSTSTISDVELDKIIHESSFDEHLLTSLMLARDDLRTVLIDLSEVSRIYRIKEDTGNANPFVSVNIPLKAAEALDRRISTIYSHVNTAVEKYRKSLDSK